jgi:hypothetical protein
MQLNGSGVESLEEERKQLMYEDLNAEFRIIFELLSEDSKTRESVSTDAELQQAIDMFLKRAAADKAKRKTSHKKSVAIERLLRFSRLKDHKTTAPDASLFKLRLTAEFSDEAAQSLLLAWLILRETSLDPVSRGVDYTLRKFLWRDTDPGFASRATTLLSALLEWWRFSERDTADSSLKQMQDLFELEACQAFLLNHKSDGTEWFNKECFEELYNWLTLLLLVEGCKFPISARTVSLRMAEAERAINLGVKLAHDVGYRSRLFVGVPEKVAPLSRAIRQAVPQ